MPLHLESITAADNDSSLLAWLLEHALQEPDSLFVSEDKRFIHSTRYIIDTGTNERVGKFVFTVEICDSSRALKILDLDITLLNEAPVRLRFSELLTGSSDSNEYYNAEITETSGHLQVETVNRHAISSDILGTVQPVYVSAFPFKLSVYDDFASLNRALGFDGTTKLAGTDMTVGGYAPDFISPGDVLQQTDETYSFVVGTVNSYRDVCARWDGRDFRFIIALLDTALGSLPTAMCPDVFDLKNLAVGKCIAMFADIKADFVKSDYEKLTQINEPKQ